MEMFLMAIALSALGVIVNGILFSAATRGEETEPFVALRAPASGVAAAARRRSGEGARFFGDAMPSMPQVPEDALLLQIEQHVRLEQAAAEAFLASPTRQSLHSRTMSPLVH